MSINIHGIEYDNGLGQNQAKQAVEALTVAYPGYSWKVDVKGGVCFVRLLNYQLRGSWGMNIKMRAIDHDAAVFKRKVVFAAGEFLERCNLMRAAAERDATIRRVDGLPEKYQPMPLQ